MRFTRFSVAPGWFMVAVSVICTACQPNLVWTGEKVYDPAPIDTIVVTGLGIDDTVHVLPGSVPFSVQRPVTNNGRGSASAGYLVRERIIRWVFQAVGGNVRWVQGDTLTSVVYRDSVAGPALASGASAPVSFDSIPALPCGLYEEDLRLDVTNAVGESNEADNQASHFFYVPSPQSFTIEVDTINDQLVHNPVRVRTHDFIIRPNPGVTVNPAAYVILFSFKATDGSTAELVPAPTVPVAPTLPGPVPGGPTVGTTVSMFVTPNRHNPGIAPPSPQVVGKITVVSADGCFLKSQTAAVFIEHG